MEKIFLMIFIGLTVCGLSILISDTFMGGWIGGTLCLAFNSLIGEYYK